MSSWSPILYGRTYEVDFRMLAMPIYFDKNDRKWSEKYIMAAIQNQNYVLENKPRWVLITNSQYCIFGSACMLSELFSEERLAEVKEYTLDQSQTRRLYAFIGYVAKRDENGQFPVLPQFEELNLELFQDIYLELVQDIWYCRNSQPEAKKPIPTNATNSGNFEDYKSKINREIAEELNINFNTKSRLVCPESEQGILWNLSVEHITGSSNQNLSVCLGLVSQKEATKSPFLNATCRNIEQRDVLPVENITKETRRKTSSEPIVLPTRERSYKRRESDNFKEKEVSLVSIEEIIGGLVGGVAGRFLPLPGLIGLGGIPGILVGGGIGVIAVGAITNKGIGAEIIKGLGFFENSQDSYSKRYRERENQVSGNKRNNNIQINSKNIGLESVDKKDSEETNIRDKNWF